MLGGRTNSLLAHLTFETWRVSEGEIPASSMRTHLDFGAPIVEKALLGNNGPPRTPTSTT